LALLAALTLLLLRALLARLLLPLLILSALLGLAVLRTLLACRFVETAVDGAALHAHDLFELPLDVIEDRVQVETVELLAALLAKLLEEVAEALHAVAVGIAHASLEKVAEGVLEVTEVHQVIGEVVED
jgi:hypothetical protein